MGASFRQTVKRRSSRPLITDLKQLKTGAAGVLFRAAVPLFSLHRPRVAHAASALPFRPTTDEQVAVEGLPGRPFKTLAVTTVAATFGLVVLGGVVRLTDSGLGCPDWPLCHGQLIPPADKATLIEYSHRLLASVVGVLAVATSVIVWVKWRHVRWMSVPAALGVVLLVGQGLLGGFTVLRELPGELVLAHLATAEALIACYVIVALVALGGPQPGGASRGIVGDKFVLAVLATALLNYGLILSGSYVTVSGAATACGESWPLCNGLPHGLLPSIHMGHRFVALSSRFGNSRSGCGGMEPAVRKPSARLWRCVHRRGFPRADTPGSRNCMGRLPVKFATDPFSNCYPHVVGTGGDGLRRRRGTSG